LERVDATALVSACAVACVDCFVKSKDTNEYILLKHYFC
jgi:hypothetical protein